MDKTEIDKLSLLARLAMSDEEKTRLAKDLDAILAYVSELTKAQAQDVPEIPALLKNVWQADEPLQPSELVSSQDILDQAPRQRDAYIVVKPVLGGSEAS